MNALSFLVSMAADGGLDGKCWTIITALATAVAAEAGFIRLLFKKLQACQEARVSSLEAKLAMVKTAKEEMSPPPGGNP